MERAVSEEHAAKKWVEKRFPTVQGNAKAMLILAYGAGLDAGLAEAQEIVEEAMNSARATVQDAARQGIGPP